MQELKEIKEEQKRAKQKAIVLQRIRQENERKEKVKQDKLKIQNYIKNSNVKSLLEEHKGQLKQIYNFILRQDKSELHAKFIKNYTSLDESKFVNFCIYFKIVPDLLSYQHVISIFRNTIKANKMLVGAGQTKNFSPQNTQAKINQVYPELNGASYENFEEMLTEIGVNLNDAFDSEGKVIESPIIYDDINNIDLLKGDEMTRLLKYMRISKNDDKSHLNVRLNLLKVEAEKIKVKPIIIAGAPVDPKNIKNVIPRPRNLVPKPIKTAAQLAAEEQKALHKKTINSRKSQPEGLEDEGQEEEEEGEYEDEDEDEEKPEQKMPINNPENANTQPLPQNNNQTNTQNSQPQPNGIPAEQKKEENNQPVSYEKK